MVKAHLPNSLPPDWMPVHMRDEPGKVLKLNARIDLVVRTDQREPLPDSVNPHANRPGVPVSVTTRENPFQFEVAVRGANCMPSLGQVAIKWLTLHAHATIWWDVLDKKMTVAIRSGRSKGPHSSGVAPPKLKWDVEVSLGGCGMPLPDCLEDWALSRLGLLVVRSFNRVNPIELDFTQMKEEERADAAQERAEAKAASARQSSSESNGSPEGAT